MRMVLALLLLMGAAQAQIAPVRGPVADIITEEAEASGHDPLLMRRIAAIESGGDCSNRTGSYIGLFQLRDGSRDCRENAKAAMALFTRLRDDFRARHGRLPQPFELYLMHQQGEAGAEAHLSNPDRLAWISMLSTGEGQQRGENWAKAAIWGNVPDDQKRKFGNVDLVTSSDFVNLWRLKVEGAGAVRDTWAEPRPWRPLYEPPLRWISEEP
jgi:hypothetical protein